MWKRCLGIGSFLGVFLALNLGALWAQETLEWKWNKGETLKYRMSMEQVSKMSGFQNVETTMNMSNVWSQEVKDVTAEGIATVEMKYESLRMEMNNPFLGKMSYDSEKTKEEEDEENPFSSLFSNLVGASFTLELDKFGKVHAIGGLDKLMESFMEGADDNPMMMAGMAGQISQMFSEDSMRQMWGTNFGFFPEKAVEPGDTWDNKFQQKIPMLGIMKAKNTLTLKGFEEVKGEKCAKISLEIKMEFDTPGGDDPNNPFGQADIKFTNTKGNGYLYFSTQKGRLIKSQNNITMGMEMVMNPDNPSMKMIMEIDQKITMELLD